MAQKQPNEKPKDNVRPNPPPAPPKKRYTPVEGLDYIVYPDCIVNKLRKTTDAYGRVRCSYVGSPYSEAELYSMRVLGVLEVEYL